jgi:hypothetical protein
VKTNVSNLEKPALKITYHPSHFDYNYYVDQIKDTWEVSIEEDNLDRQSGWDELSSIAADKLLNETDITHIGFLPDDFVYNPEWMQQLSFLITRHPEARAWSVYRSNYKLHHRIIGGDGIDVLMTMHDALGTMTRKEWFEYGASSREDFTSPPSMGGGCSIDIHHAFIRPGEYWATSKDYMQNLGVHPGLEGQDCAIEFVGE